MNTRSVDNHRCNEQTAMCVASVDIGCAVRISHTLTDPAKGCMAHDQIRNFKVHK